MINDANLGRVVRATAGRDNDELFVIIQIVDNDYVLIVNGKNRSIKNPKRKKLKHLILLDTVFPDIAEKANKKRLLDADIRKAIKLCLK